MKYFLFFKASLKLQLCYSTFVLHGLTLIHWLSRQETVRSVRHGYSGRYKANKLRVDHPHQRQKQQDQSKLEANFWCDWEMCARHISWLIMEPWNDQMESNRHIFAVLSLWGMFLTFYVGSASKKLLWVHFPGFQDGHLQPGPHHDPYPKLPQKCPHFTACIQTHALQHINDTGEKLWNRFFKRALLEHIIFVFFFI